MSILAGGPFGEAGLIADKAAHLFIAAGANEEAVRYAVHPLLDNYVWEACRTGIIPEPAPGLLTAQVPGLPGETCRWFDRSHSADSLLKEEIQDALIVELDRNVGVQVPSRQFQDFIRDAEQVLVRAIPDIWDSTKPFVTRVYDMQTEMVNSATFDNIGGAVVLSSSLLSHNKGRREQVTALAECLLHEAAHSKSFRIFRSFKRVSVPESPDFIDIPWWRTGRGTWNWDIDRSIVAAHVYTHLSTFYKVLAAEDSDFEYRGNIMAFRARFLSNVLLQLGNEWIDSEWRAFIEWFSQAIPPISGIGEAGARELNRDIRTFDNYHLVSAGPA